MFDGDEALDLEFSGAVEATVDPRRDGMRADSAAAELFGISRTRAAKLIETGDIIIDGHEASKKDVVSTGQTLEMSVSEPIPCEAMPEDIALDVAYEDGDVIVINKPSGMVVHPAPGHDTGTLVSALLWHCRDSLSGIGGVTRPGIVHRIDRQTSGLIAVAKNDEAHEALAAQLADHSMYRVYLAIVVGHLRDESGVIDAPIGRSPKDRKKMAVVQGARSARTHYRVVERFTGASLVELRLETGRTHQIRVHMAYVGHPVLGDEVYGGASAQFVRRHPALFDGQMLHAVRLSFTHPRTGEAMSFEAPPPENFERCVELLRGETK
jgi:23S rRNA pseudouridine1911/1915/1917 synthase